MKRAKQRPQVQLNTKRAQAKRLSMFRSALRRAGLRVTGIQLIEDARDTAIAASAGQRSLSGVLSKFAQFSPDLLAEGRGDQEQIERD